MGSIVSITLQKLADIVGADLIGDKELLIDSVASLDTANNSQITFIASSAFKKSLASTSAAAVILEPAYKDDCLVAALVVNNVLAAFAKIADYLHPYTAINCGIHSSAIIDSSAKIDPSANIGPLCVIGAGAVIEKNVNIESSCVVEQNCVIKSGSILHSNVTITFECEIGKNTIIHPGAVIGSDGFGNAHENGKWVKIPQLGRVIIGDDVEVGANTAIDRGALNNTIIHDGVRIDNLVHIAHNVEIGENSALAGCVGMAGSTTIGKNCMFGGQVGISGHLTITDNVIVTGGTAVFQSIDKPGTYSSGYPLDTNKNWRRSYIRVKQIDDMAKRIKKLEKLLENKD